MKKGLQSEFLIPKVAAVIVTASKMIRQGRR